MQARKKRPSVPAIHPNATGIPVAWRRHGFNGQLMRQQFRPGMTVEEILLAIGDELPEAFWRLGFVCINGEELPRTLWPLTVPVLHRDYISLHINIGFGGQGGGGNGAPQKNPLATIAMVAVVVAATLVSAGAFGPLGGTLFSIGAASFSGAQVAGAALLITGTLAIAALTPSPNVPKITGGTDDVQGKQASLSANLLQPNGYLPRAIGTRRIYPSLACYPLIDVVNGDQVVEAVYVFAGPHQWNDVRQGDVALSDAGDLTYETREGRGDGVIQSLVGRHSFSTAPQIELSRHAMDGTIGYHLALSTSPQPLGLAVTSDTMASVLPGYHVVASRAPQNGTPDEVWLTFALPEGLSNQTTPEPINTILRIEFRKKGGNGGWTPCPEIHLSGVRMTPVFFTVRFMWRQEPPYAYVTQDRESFDKAGAVNGGPVYLRGQSGAQSGAGGVTGATGQVYTADTYFDAANGQPWYATSLINRFLGNSSIQNAQIGSDRVLFFLDPDVYEPGAYEFRIRQSAPYRGSFFTLSNYNYAGADSGAPTNAGIIYDFFYWNESTSNSPRLPNDISKMHYKCVLLRVTSVKNENPIKYSDMATLSIRAINRSIDQVNALVSGLVPTWTGSAWDGLNVSTDPATNYRYVLTGPLAAQPIPTSLISNQQLLDWAVSCAYFGRTVNALADGRNQSDVLKIIAGAGAAIPQQAEQFGVVVDRDRTFETPVQLFSADNVRGFSMEVAFVDRPSGIRARFDRKSDDHKEAQITVLDPYAINPDNPLEEVRYEGIDTDERVREQALMDLRQSIERMVFYGFDANAASIICRKGDTIAVQHDLLSSHAGYGRIKALTFDGSSNVTSVTLERPIPVPDATTGHSYFRSDAGLYWTSSSRYFRAARLGMYIRAQNGSFILQQITATASPARVLTPVTPFAPGAIALGCQVVTGLLGKEYSRFIVHSIQAARYRGAHLTVVPTGDIMFRGESMLEGEWGHADFSRSLYHWNI